MSENVVEILKKIGAIITDSHFVYTSDKHGSVYINKDALYPHTEDTSKIGRMFAEKYKDADVEVVAGPALGGIILSQWTASHLSVLKGKEVLSVYTEKTADKKQVFTRGYDKLVQGKNVLIIEDLTTTGGSVKKVLESVKECGGNVIGVCVMINRSPDIVTTEMIGVPFDALGVFPVKIFDEGDCPMCKAGVRVNTDVGHGRKYLERSTSN